MNNKLQEWSEQLYEIKNKSTNKDIFDSLNYQSFSTNSEFRDYLVDLINEINYDDKARQELQLLYAEVNSTIRLGSF
jgi:formate dehydrogenase maturation protein FdhE